MFAFDSLICSPVITEIIYVVQLCLATAYYPGIKGLTPFKDSETSFSTSVPATESLEPLRNISLSKVNSK